MKEWRYEYTIYPNIPCISQPGSLLASMFWSLHSGIQTGKPFEVIWAWIIYGGFLKWWYPKTMGFPTKNDHLGVFWGYHHFRKHPYIYIQYILYYISPVHFLFSVPTAVFGEEHDLVLSLLRWAIGREQKSTKDCQTQNCLHDARVYICSMLFDFKWTSYSCSMILAHSWKLWFGLCVFVRTKFHWLKLCFLSFLPVFSIWNWAKRQHFIHLGARAGAASVYNWATETWWPPPITRR